MTNRELVKLLQELPPESPVEVPVGNRCYSVETVKLFLPSDNGSPIEIIIGERIE